jgi:hypothetical protein
MKIIDLLKVKYTDYENQVKLYLSKTLTKYEENYGNSTIVGQLVNVIGSTVQNILLYIEDALTEQNKYTAQRKKSIYSLAQISGYNPSLGKAATCTVCLSLQPNNYSTYSVVISNKMKMTCAYNGLTYNVILPQEAITVNINLAQSNKYLQLVEGTFETQSFVATGGQYYTQTVLFNGDMDLDYLEVKVNDVLWTREESLYDMEPDGLQYVAKTSLTKGIDLLFGNDQFGRALSADDKIEVTYLLHDGELGNIIGNEPVYFSFEDEITDATGEPVSANEIFVVTLNDNNSVSSGTYSETAEKVKELIGYNSRALVLADPKNYKIMLNRFSFVGYNRTWSEEGSLIVNSIVLRNFANATNTGSEYFSLKKSDMLLTDEQKTSIKNYIANSGRQLAGVTYQIIDPTLCKYACYIYLKMKNVSYDEDSVKQQIRNLVGEFFMDLLSDFFIPKSDIIKLLKDNIDSIDSVDLYFIGEQNENAITNKRYIQNTYTFNPISGIYDTVSETVYVEEGTNPGLGFDDYGNIYLTNNDQIPVLMGGWKFLSSNTGDAPQYTQVTDPLTIIFRS